MIRIRNEEGIHFCTVGFDIRGDGQVVLLLPHPDETEERYIAYELDPLVACRIGDALIKTGETIIQDEAPAPTESTARVIKLPTGSGRKRR